MRKIINGYVFEVNDKLLKTRSVAKKKIIYNILFFTNIILLFCTIFLLGFLDLQRNSNNLGIIYINKCKVPVLGIIIALLFITFFILIFKHPSDYYLDYDADCLEFARDIEEGNVINLQLNPHTDNDNMFAPTEGTISYEKKVDDYNRIYKKYDVDFDPYVNEELIEVEPYSITVSSPIYYNKQKEHKEKYEEEYYEKMCKENNIKICQNKESNDYKAGFINALCQVRLYDEKYDYDSCEEMIKDIMKENLKK